MNTKKILWLQNLCAMLLTAALILSKPVFSYPENVIPPVQSGDWLYFDRGDWVSVCGYLGKEEHITIPSSIDGKEVTELSFNGVVGDGYFSGQFKRNCFFGAFGTEWWTDNLDEPDPVTRRITIPDTVKRIGEATFYQCFTLTQVDMPQGLKTIGDRAFAACQNLLKADIPTSIERIGEGAFSSTDINDFVIPDSVSYIGAEAFSGTPVTEINIPDTVRYIGEGAFSGCDQLKTAKLPTDLKEISSELFRGCNELESIEIPDTVKIIGAGAFKGCSSLKSVQLPKRITEIPSSLFSNCSSLRNVEIPEGVQKIGEDAFACCGKLEEIHFPKTLKSAIDIFRENSALKSISFAAEKDEVEAIMGANLLKENMAKYDYVHDYGNVLINYGEKDETPKEKTAEDIIRDILKLTATVFFSLFLIALCLTKIQKAALKPKKAEHGGNVLTKFNSPDMITCKRCGTASGKEAKYCCNCGKKLTAKLSKGKGKEQTKK